MPRSSEWRRSKRRYEKTKFQHWLSNLMAETELFNDEVAAIIGVHPATITCYILGEQNPSYHVLQKFRTAFDCNMNELI